MQHQSTEATFSRIFLRGDVVKPGVCRQVCVAQHLALRCRDADSMVRKYASFAVSSAPHCAQALTCEVDCCPPWQVGNAAFYTAALYELLREAIPALVALVEDRSSDQKTRSNAAGALGNMVRNSGLLCSQLVSCASLGVNVCACLLTCACSHKPVP